VPTIVFSQPVAFPIGPLRTTLAKYCDGYKWRCGEDDDGGPDQMGRYGRSDIVMGRAGGDMVMVTLTARHEPLAPPAPPHQWVLEVSNPTTDDERMSNRILGIICSTLMFPDVERAFCQLTHNGKWLRAAELIDAMDDVLRGKPLAEVGGGTTMPGTTGRYQGLSPDQALNLSQMDEAMARILHEKGMGSIADDMGLTQAPRFARELPQPNKLPTLVMLSTSPLFIDWAMTAEMLRAVDRDGDWQVTPDGPTSGRLTGRGAVVTISCADQPLPAYLTTQGLAREHFLTAAMRAEVMSHRAWTAFEITLDTEAAGFIATRQTAKAVAMAMAPLAKNPSCVGLFNAGLGVARPAQRVCDSIAALMDDEVPIGVWIWAAPDSPVTDAVSMSTSGMRPFVGYEVECWNAPGTIVEVGERVNGVLRYLLINGPVINHGDTIGIDTGDKSTRCFHGVSNAQRAEEGVPALLLEFDNKGGVASAPKRDIHDDGSIENDPIKAALAAARAGASLSPQELNESILAAAISTRPKPPSQPAMPGADDMAAMLAELRKGADATSQEALDAIAAAIANPPSRDVIESDDNPVFKNLMKLIEHEQETGTLPKPAPVPAQPKPQPMLNGRPLFGRKAATGFGRKGL
jgi:Domain of unknown function (DUF4261)